METTFMTIHNLSPDANILFASDSVTDILGYQPNELNGRSCFDYFHPDEIPTARYVRDRSVDLDKASVLHYARIKAADGQWVGCECVFTIVYDVMVACTSIYRQGLKSERRAAEAPAIRRLFASSPRDPRYHMLEHLSAKFRNPIKRDEPREPRAALILNRFSRTMTIMYATTAVADILGVSADTLMDKSFYECIQENCLGDALRCLESAKANDSIAYLRFWYRDPRRAEDMEENQSNSSDSDEDGGVRLNNPNAMDLDHTPRPDGEASGSSSGAHNTSAEESHNSSGNSTDLEGESASRMFDQNQTARSSTSSVPLQAPQSGEAAGQGRRRRRARAPEGPIEIEAVVSCTSDGLVVILRRARPMIPEPIEPAVQPMRAGGLFAAPWGVRPIQPHAAAYAPHPEAAYAPEPPVAAAGGPPLNQLMNSIREIAVFAWSLTGINGNIAKYARGQPRGEAVPPEGYPVWDPHAQNASGAVPENQAAARWSEWERTNEGNAPFGNPRNEQLLRQQNGFGQHQAMESVLGGPSRNFGGAHGPASEHHMGYINQAYENARSFMRGEPVSYQNEVSAAYGRAEQNHQYAYAPANPSPYQPQNPYGGGNGNYQYGGGYAGSQPGNGNGSGSNGYQYGSGSGSGTAGSQYGSSSDGQQPRDGNNGGYHFGQGQGQNGNGNGY